MFARTLCPVVSIADLTLTPLLDIADNTLKLLEMLDCTLTPDVLNADLTLEPSLVILPCTANDAAADETTGEPPMAKFNNHASIMHNLY